MSDDEFLAAFENCSLPFEHWDHRAHVRAAFLSLCRWRPDEAIERMRSGIKAYNTVHGVEDGPQMGYHQTTTQAFLRLIHRAIQERGPFQVSDDFCLSSPELLDRRVLLCYYTRDRMMEPDAKANFVEPDIAPLDRIGLVFPEFGRRLERVSYKLRPGGYGVIADDAGRIALVVTPAGTFLPGGGQEPGETAIAAVRREVLEECGITVGIGRPIGVADEFAFAVEEDQHFCKRCSFYSAVRLTSGPGGEFDHRLIWLSANKTIEQLSHDSHRWAVSRWLDQTKKLR